MKFAFGLLVALGTLVVFSPAEAAGCHGHATADQNGFNAGFVCSTPPDPTPQGGSVVEPPTVPDSNADVGVCAAAGVNDPAACQAAQQPQVTPGAVAQAFQQIPVPHLASVTQPAGRTLVNFDTIFYVDAQPFDAGVTLLGHQVRLHVRPVSYAWDHGDGSVTTTDVPGAPYPRKQVLHRYQQAGATFSHHVAVTWAATFQVDGGPVADVPGTVTTVGPATAIRVVEATPVLTGDR